MLDNDSKLFKVDIENFKFPDKNSKKLKLLTAAYVENIRLIDNLDVKL